MGRLDRLDRVFDGIMPRRAERNLPDTCAQVANNCRLLSTRLEPLNAPDFDDMTTTDDQNIALEDWFTLEEPNVIGIGDIDHMFNGEGCFMNMVVGPHASTNGYHIGGDEEGDQHHPGDIPSQTEIVCPLIALKWRGNNVKMKFHFPGLEWRWSAGVGGIWQMILVPQAVIDTGDEVVKLPETAAFTTSAVGMFTESLEVFYEGESYGHFRISDMTFENIDWEWGTQASYPNIRRPMDIILDCDMSYHDNRTRRYYYVGTNVTDLHANGDPVESPPSKISDVAVVPPGHYHVLAAGSLRVYRSSSKRVLDTNLFHLSDGSITDTKTDGELGPRIPPWGNKPDSMLRTNTIIMPGGYACGFTGSELWFTDIDRHIMYWQEIDKDEAWKQGKRWTFKRHYAWPREHTKHLEFPIIKIASSGSDIVVFTRETNSNPVYGPVYIIYGTTPDTMTRRKISMTRACINVNSVVHLGGVVYYVCNEGLVAIRNGQDVLVSEEFYTRREWQLLNPSTMVGRVYDEKLFLFTNGSETDGIRYNPAGGLSSFITFDDLSGGTLTWQSKEDPTPKRAAELICRVRAEGTVQLRLYADGSLVHTEADITDSTDFKIPASVGSAETWSYDVQSTEPIDEVLVMQREVMQINSKTTEIGVQYHKDRFTWRAIQLKFPKRGSFTTGKITSENYPVTFNLYSANSVTPVYTRTVNNNQEFRIDIVRDEQLWEFDAINANGIVDEVRLATTSRGLE